MAPRTLRELLEDLKARADDIVTHRPRGGYTGYQSGYQIGLRFAVRGICELLGHPRWVPDVRSDGFAYFESCERCGDSRTTEEYKALLARVRGEK